MNVITHDAAYSLFPYATFQQRRSFIFGGNGRKQDDARDKYRRRGWKLELRMEGCEMIDPRSDFSWRRRRVGDRHCWMIPFRPALVDDPQTEKLIRDRITSNSWYTRHWHKAIWMSFKIVKSSNLRFEYICADDEIFRFCGAVLSDPMYA